MKHVLLSLVAVGMAQVANAADLVHNPSYEAGKTHVSEAEVGVAQTLTINGADVVTSSDQYLVIAETVEEASDDGATLRGGFRTLQVDLMIAGSSYNFNSENPDASTPPPGLEPLADLYRGLIDVEWTTEISDGRVESMEYVGDAFADLDPALRGEVELQRYVDDANQQAERLPGEGIAVDQTWERTETMNLGSGQSFSIEREFTYVGSEEVNGRTLECVNVNSVDVSYAIEPNPNLPLSVRSSDLDIETVDGAFWYDPAMGTIVKSTEEIHVTGDLELEIMGMVLPSKLDLTISSTTTLSVE